MAHTVLNGKWVFGIQSISRARRCIDKVLHFIVSASLKNIEGSHNIALHVNFWVLDGVAHASLCGEMNNPVWTAFLENLVNSFFVFQVIFVEGEIIMFLKNFKPIIYRLTS